MRPSRLIPIVLTAALFLTACSGEGGTTVPTANSPSPASTTPAPSPADYGTIWMSTFKAETPAQIHLAGGGKAVMPGDEFKLTDDGAYVALKTGNVLEVAKVDGTGREMVSQHVHAFMWRPATHDLLYLVRNPDNLSRATWHLRGGDGTDRPLVELSYANALPAEVSPTGKWLGYYDRLQLNVVSLDDKASYAFAKEAGDSVGRARWAGPNHLTLTNGQKVVIVQVPSGERTTVYDLGRAPRTDPQWSADGTVMAILTEEALVVFRNGQQVVTCAGSWHPVDLSPDGRYLAVRKGTTAQERQFIILEVDRGPEACAAKPLPGAESLVAWRANYPLVIVSSQDGNAKPGYLQLWELTNDGPVLRKGLGTGIGAAWVPGQTR